MQSESLVRDCVQDRRTMANLQEPVRCEVTLGWCRTKRMKNVRLYYPKFEVRAKLSLNCVNNENPNPPNAIRPADKSRFAGLFAVFFFVLRTLVLFATCVF